jgi:Flagellar hook-length control protein FliK
MNVTMPAPPAAPPIAAPTDRAVAGVQPKTTSTTSSTGRRTDDERTFEDQLDEVAVALAVPALPTPIDAHAKTPPAAGPTPVVATAGGATPATMPAPNPLTPAADSLTSAALIAAPVALTAEPIITEIEGSPTPLTTTATAAPATLAPATPAPATPAPVAADTAVTHDVPGPAGAPIATTNDPAAAAAATAPTTDPTTAGSVPPTMSGTLTEPIAPPVAPLPSPSASPPIATTSPTPVDGAGSTAPQAVLAAIVDAAPDATVAAETDAATDVDSAEIDNVAVADTSTPPVLTNLTMSARRDDASAGRVGGLAPAIAAVDADTDDLPAPIRLAPPRTIAVDLNDEGLGPLRVIATTEQRSVHLTVSAGEAVVRDALVRQQADLRHDLAEVGLQLGSFEVDARAANRDDTDQPALTGDRDRPAAKPARDVVATAPVHRTHDADGRLDLRL